MHRILSLLALSLVIALPAQAVTLSIDDVDAGTASTFAVPVRINAEGTSINSVEGSINVPPGVTIDRIDRTGSVFSLWIEGPVYVPSERIIAFTGGVPGGIESSANELLFTIYAHSATPGSYSFAPEGVVAYRNDGTGGDVIVSAEASTLAIGEDADQPATNVDPVIRSPLYAEVGQDASLFDGAAFIALAGGDAEYFIVNEGLFSRGVRADDFYVLKDQARTSTIRVTAVQSDGTRTLTTIPAENPWPERALLAVVIVFALSCAWLLARALRRRV